MWIEQRSVHGKVRYCFIERYKSSLTGHYRRVSVTYGKKTPQVVKTATRELEEKAWPIFTILENSGFPVCL